ncbi:MAG: hypothetical protein ACYC9W_09855, partial [Candidatus Limnocylindria bacterium]
MFEKLLSLLLHAKAGAISGVFLLGATGALISVSASNGVTTVTLTDPSPSPSASASPSAGPSATPTPTATATQSPEPSSSPEPSASPTATSCTVDQANVLALQVQRVDSAFAVFHTDLAQLRSQRAEATIEQSDHLLKQIRQAGVKAIHATLTCTTNDEDQADTDATTAGANAKTDSDHGTASITFTGTDPAAIADQAIAAMQAAFDTANNAPATTPKPSRSPEQKQHDTQKHDGHG